MARLFALELWRILRSLLGCNRLSSPAFVDLLR
jgi:hypothetical protein